MKTQKQDSNLHDSPFGIATAFAPPPPHDPKTTHKTAKLPQRKTHGKTLENGGMEWGYVVWLLVDINQDARSPKSTV